MQSESETNTEARMGRKNLQTFSSILILVLVSYAKIPQVLQRHSSTIVVARRKKREKNSISQLRAGVCACVCLSVPASKLKETTYRGSRGALKNQQRRSNDVEKLGSTKTPHRTLLRNKRKKGPPLLARPRLQNTPKVTTRRRCNFSLRM
jgi:hypothetical protein